MRLTTFTDYSLRVLIYLGANPGRLSTIRKIAEAYGISQNDLMKIVQQLAALDYVETVRGKGGGLRLARDPKEINIGAVVRACEPGMVLAECFEPDHDCRIERACILKGAFRKAGEAFFSVLDEYSLADLLRNRNALAASLGLGARGAAAPPAAG